MRVGRGVAVALGATLLAPLLLLVTPASAIVNGTPARATDMPFTVAILDRADYVEKGAFTAQFCGGALTTPTTVVTAAHCLIDPTNLQPVTASSILIGSGLDLKSSSLRVVDVAAISVHPRYLVKSATFDVGVITLAAPLSGVPTVTVQRAGSRELQPGAPARVAGWGNTKVSVETYPSTLMIGDVSIFPPNACGAGDAFAVDGVIFDGFGSGQANSKTMVCAAGVTDDDAVIDACQGDSGSPLVTTSPTQLVGVVSWGEECATTHPGVYTRLSAYTAFLESNAVFGLPTAPAITLHPLNGSARVAFAPTAQPSLLIASTVKPDGTVVQCATKPSRTIVPATCLLRGLDNDVPVSVSGVAQMGIEQSPPSPPVFVTPIDAPITGAITKVTVRGATARLSVTRATQERTLNCVSPQAVPELNAAIPVNVLQIVLRPVRMAEYVCVIRGTGAASSVESAPRLLARKR